MTGLNRAICAWRVRDLTRSLMGIDSYGYVLCAHFTGMCLMDKQMIGLISMRRTRLSPRD